MFIRQYRKVLRKLGFQVTYPSETSKVRARLLQFCEGYGCDIGFGGDKIKKENCVGIDLPSPYAKTGSDQVDIACDVINDPIPVEDNTFDYVYTSHLIEDYTDTAKGLREFIRILKSGGLLILVFPDQQAYEAICRKTGQELNTYHVHKNMGYQFMIDAMQLVSGIRYSVVYESILEIDYNVIIVFKIYKNGEPEKI